MNNPRADLNRRLYKAIIKVNLDEVKNLISLGAEYKQNPLALFKLTLRGKTYGDKRLPITKYLMRLYKRDYYNNNYKFGRANGGFSYRDIEALRPIQIQLAELAIRNFHIDTFEYFDKLFDYFSSRYVNLLFNHLIKLAADGINDIALDDNLLKYNKEKFFKIVKKLYDNANKTDVRLFYSLCILDNDDLIADLLKKLNKKVNYRFARNYYNHYNVVNTRDDMEFVLFHGFQLAIKFGNMRICRYFDCIPITNEMREYKYDLHTNNTEVIKFMLLKKFKINTIHTTNIIMVKLVKHFREK